MYLPDLVIRSRHVVSPTGTRPAAVHIRNGKIIGVVDLDDVPEGCSLEDAGDHAVMPGIVDTQVRAQPYLVQTNLTADDVERGFADGLEAATRAAAAGGVTTIVDMPRGPLATAAVPDLDIKRRAAGGRCFVDVGFWGSVVPGNAHHLVPLFEAGVLGFACDLQQASAGGGAAVSEADLRAAMPVVARTGATLLAHTELAGAIASRPVNRFERRGWLERLPWVPHASRPRRYATYLESRPKALENDAVALVIGLCRQHGTRTHIASLSSSDVLTPLFRARAERLPITAATCPHYLFFVAEEVRGNPAAFICEPPIRERANRELLWAALANGLVQLLASDHVAAGQATAQPGIGRPGISSLELSLSVTWTVARARGLALDQLAEWMCRRPAELAGLTRKGKIDVGYDADLVVFDPDAEFTVESRARLSAGRPTPYAGRRLRGVVERTYLRGTEIYRRPTSGARQSRASIEARQSRAPIEARQWRAPNQARQSHAAIEAPDRRPSGEAAHGRLLVRPAS